MSAPYLIASLALGQALGSTAQVMCPRCLGGSQERECMSLTVRDDGGIYWCCHRASCGYRGGPRGKRTLQVPPVKAAPEPKVYTRQTKTLTPDQNELLRGKYGMYFPAVRYNDETDRFILPCLGPRLGQSRGVVARSFSGDQPKVKIYKEGEPFIHFAYPRDTARRYIAVIVEDYFSAEKCAKAGFLGISLNGTNLNQFAVDEIKENTQGRVILALDLDAYPKALQLQAKFREQFPKGFSVMRLEKDLKFETEERINEKVDEILNQR